MGFRASPTFFGPNGSDYVMLTDNSDIQESVIVYRTDNGAKVGSVRPVYCRYLWH